MARSNSLDFANDIFSSINEDSPSIWEILFVRFSTNLTIFFVPLMMVMAAEVILKILHSH